MTTPITTDAYNVAYAERQQDQACGYYVQRMLDKREKAAEPGAITDSALSREEQP